MRKKLKEKEIYRAFDVTRGAFDPVERDPVMNRETNPRGVRHIAKTEQDRLPVSERPRVQAWRQRQAG